MATAYITHPTCRLHDMDQFHPESPARLAAIEDHLITQGIKPLLMAIDAPEIKRSLVEAVHDSAYVEKLFAIDRTLIQQPNKMHQLDADTAMNKYSLAAALHAAGAGIAALDGVMQQTFSNAFCAVRPPGHHAERHRAMGFCLFNNIAIAANYALQHYCLDRVAIVDFDVHHGNGTEDIFAGRASVLYCSSYQYPLFPYSNAAEKADNTIHCPLPAGTTGAEFRAQYENVIFPAIANFQPQLLLISAGFDGHRDDPLANWRLTDEDFNWLTQQLMQLAQRYCEGRLVSFLEGGYDLNALGRCVCAHIKILAGLK